MVTDDRVSDHNDKSVVFVPKAIRKYEVIKLPCNMQDHWSKNTNIGPDQSNAACIVLWPANDADYTEAVAENVQLCGGYDVVDVV